MLVAHLFEASPSNLRIQEGKISAPQFKFQAKEIRGRRAKTPGTGNVHENTTC
jgi:hypothetical protein